VKGSGILGGQCIYLKFGEHCNLVRCKFEGVKYNFS
jgi:hypothetical protein